MILFICFRFKEFLFCSPRTNRKIMETFFAFFLPSSVISCYYFYYHHCAFLTKNLESRMIHLQRYFEIKVQLHLLSKWNFVTCYRKRIVYQTSVQFGVKNGSKKIVLYVLFNEIVKNLLEDWNQHSKNLRKQHSTNYAQTSCFSSKLAKIRILNASPTAI